MTHASSEITKLDKHSQGTTRNKYKVLARAKAMKHDELMDKVQDHMLSCEDDDCDLCDMGQSGSSLDNDDEEPETSHNMYNRGSRSSAGREGAGYKIDQEGEAAVKESKGDKHNLMKHGFHTSKEKEEGHAAKGHSAKHPGFKKVAEHIAGKQHISEKAASRILAFRTRNASASAKKANPRLKRVAG